MIAADSPLQRPRWAKLLVVRASGEMFHARRAAFVDFLRTGDVVIANDAATLPASLQGQHAPSGFPIEIRLAGRHSLGVDDVLRFSAVVFGAGDYRTRTENRDPPPRIAPADRLDFGPLRATVEQLLGHPRLAAIRFEGPPEAVWTSLARYGRPIQYAHVRMPLTLWDVWTSIAALPVAFESPSAGFALDWQAIATMRARGIEFGTVTHAAGISSTGDDELDRRLPFDEPYRIPPYTAAAIVRARCAEVALSRLVRPWCEHSNMERPATILSRPERGWPRSALAGQRSCGSWMRSCLAYTNPAPATTRCFEPFRAMRRSLAPTTNLSLATTSRMNLAIPFSSSAPGDTNESLFDG